MSEYFSSATPRVPGGNDGTTVVHSLPTPSCRDPECPEATSVSIDTITTLWPQILQINPETGTEVRLPIASSFSINDGSGGSVNYELIGTVSFSAKRKHWTSKIVIGKTAFAYDDLVHGGSLVAQGPADLICAADRRATLWMYNRTSKSAQVRYLEHYIYCD